LAELKDAEIIIIGGGIIGCSVAYHLTRMGRTEPPAKRSPPPQRHAAPRINAQGISMRSAT